MRFQPARLRPAVIGPAVIACAVVGLGAGCAPGAVPGPAAELVGDVTITVAPAVSTVLVVTWTENQDVDEAWVRYGFDGSWYETPVHRAPRGPQRAVLLGVPADTNVTVEVHNRVDGVDTPTPSENVSTAPLQAATGSLPDDLIVPTLTLLDEQGVSPEPYLLTSVDTGIHNFHGPFYTVILDRQARVVWYRLTSGKRMTVFPRVSADGTHLTIDASTYFVTGDPSITRIALDGSVDQEIPVNGLGFGYSESADGSFWYDDSDGSTAYFLARQTPDGSAARVWDCNAWMDSYTVETYACGVNEVLYDEAHQSVLWSMFGTSTVAEVDANSGELLRYFGSTPGGYAIVPDTVQLKLQHAPTWTPDGNIILTTHVPDDESTQVIREFSLDDATRTATEVWSYTSAAGHYGGMEGDVTRLANGNTLIGYGIGGIIEEIDADSNVVWQLDWREHLTGHMTLIPDLYALVQ